MSATVKLSAQMPGHEDTNGLDHLVEDLIDDPRKIRFGVVWFDTQKVTLDTDSGDSIPTVRLRRFEPLGSIDDVPAEIRTAVAVAHELRTGRAPLPFEAIEGAEHEIDED